MPCHGSTRINSEVTKRFHTRLSFWKEYSRVVHARILPGSAKANNSLPYMLGSDQIKTVSKAWSGEIWEILQFTDYQCPVFSRVVQASLGILNVWGVGGGHGSSLSVPGLLTALQTLSCKAHSAGSVWWEGGGGGGGGVRGVRPHGTVP